MSTAVIVLVLYGAVAFGQPAGPDATLRVAQVNAHGDALTQPAPPVEEAKPSPRSFVRRETSIHLQDAAGVAESLEESDNDAGAGVDESLEEDDNDADAVAGNESLQEDEEFNLQEGDRYLDAVAGSESLASNWKGWYTENGNSKYFLKMCSSGPSSRNHIGGWCGKVYTDKIGNGKWSIYTKSNGNTKYYLKICGNDQAKKSTTVAGWCEQFYTYEVADGYRVWYTKSPSGTKYFLKICHNNHAKSSTSVDGRCEKFRWNTR
jgi:hypothetical protein